MSQRWLIILHMLFILTAPGSLFAQNDKAERTSVIREELRGQSTQGQTPSRVDIPSKGILVPSSQTPDALVNNNGGAGTIGNFTQSETGIVAFGNNVVIGFNDAGSYNGSNSQFTGFSYSTNGGATFIDGGTLPTSTTGDAGDPVLARNETTGRIYLSTLGFNSPGTIQMWRSDNNGVTWMAPVNATPGGSDEDKQWHTVDNFPGSGNGNVYVISRRFGSPAGIYVFRSTDHGATFTPSGGTLIVSGQQGAFIAVGPDHAVYAFWWNSASLQMRKSTDFGVTFASAVTVASGLTGGSNGDLGLTGTRQGTTSASAFRSNSFPHAAINPVSGHIYVTYNNPGTGGDKGDILFVLSTNGGTTWTSPVKVNDDGTTRDQWQPTIAVNPGGTKVGIFYYSRQEDPANNLFKYYGRIGNIVGSTVTFDPSFAVSDVASYPEFGRDNVINSTYMGDYNHAAATADAFHVVWSDNRDDLAGGAGRKDPNVYYKKIPTTDSFGWVKGTITNVSGGSPLQNVTVDFVQGIPQVQGTTTVAGLYSAGARVDTPGTTANLTLRGRKFGFRDTTIAVTVTRNDTVTRNFAMTPAANGTLFVRTIRTDSAAVRSNVRVSFGGNEVVNTFTDSLTGNYSTTLPTGTYSVIIDPPSPYATRTFNSTVINTGQTTSLYTVIRPVVEQSPLAMRDTLAVGQVHVKTMVLTNTTADSVPFRLTDDVALRMASPRTVVPEPVSQPPAVERAKGSADFEFGVSPDGAGGPDAFGYRWIDSDEPGGPTFNWVEVSSIGTELTGFAPDRDDGVATIALPWSFPLYGNFYSSMNVVTNGFMNFGATSTAFTNGAIPSTTAPNNAIYPFWDDLDLRTSGKVYYYNDVPNSRFIVQYEKAPRYGTTAVDTLTFQIILKPSGEIMVQYLRVVGTVLNSGTIGIENAAGTVALQVVYNAAYVHNNLATRFYLPDAPWLSENPTVGTIAPLSTQNVQVTFDATGLNEGTTYNGKILMELTHPDVTGAIEIPASLKVQPANAAVLILDRASVTFPATQSNTTRRDTLTARNGGSQVLTITSISSTSARFVVSPSSASLPPGDSVKIPMAYTPLAVGTDTGRVRFLSNSQGAPVIDVLLSGTGIGAPAINVSPLSLADTVQAGAISNKSFSITNTAASPAAPLIVGLVPGAPWISVVPVADTLTAGQTKQYVVTLNVGGTLPVGVVTSSIGISTNAPATPNVNVTCMLDVRSGPVIVTRPDSLTRVLAAGNSATDTLVIRNTGTLPLNWSMSEVPATQPDITGSYYLPGPPLPKGIDDGRSISPLATEGRGGPDAFGYRWVDSNEPDGPVFNWVDISGTGVALDSSSAWVPTGTFRGGDEGYYPVVLPFQFNYYGVANDTLFIGTNGNVSFQRPTGNTFTNAAFPTAGGTIDNHIGIFWDDLEVRGRGRVYYGVSGGSFVVQYDSIPIFNVSVPNYTFQIILKPTGEWITQYKSMGFNGGTLISATIGMENAGGTIGLTVVHNAAYMQDNLAIRFGAGISWLDESPTSGTVAPNDSQKVVVTFNSTGLPDGVYRGTLQIASNDLTHNPKVVPVRLTVGVPTVSVPVAAGWNLISNPVNAPNDSVLSLFPSASFNYAFAYSQLSGYSAVYRLSNGKGYWEKFPASTNHIMPGTFRTSDTVAVQEGWNIVGSISTAIPVGQVTTVPPGIIGSPFYAFQDGYGQATSIIPGKGYWLKTNAPGTLILHGTTPTAPVRKVESGELLSSYTNLTIRDSRGGSQQLLLGFATPGPESNAVFELPPPGPEGVFDARFESQRMVEQVDARSVNRRDFPISIRSTDYPVTVSWDVRESDGYRLTLSDGMNGSLVTKREISGAGELMITNPSVTRLIISAEPMSIPAEYALSANYPNPFNPSTRIEYALPEQAVLTLKVYDLLGQEVATLFEGSQMAGYQAVEWNGRNQSNHSVASGIYFYRLEAVGVSGATHIIQRKMLLLK